MSQRQAGYTIKKFYDPLDDLLDRPIAFNPAFKKITGSTVAALMLSQAWYWSKRTSDENGWFYKIGIEWEDETGLTRSEQETARKHLKNLGILEEDLRDVPARLYYRIDKQKIYDLLGIQFATFPQTRLPEEDIQDSDILANINKNTEITTEIKSVEEKKSIPDNYPIEWYIQHGLSIPGALVENNKREQAAINAFESAFGITRPWNWYANEHTWKDFRKWMISCFEKDNECFVRYSEWRNGKGQYKGAMNNVAIKRNPELFPDSWDMFMATSTYSNNETKAFGL